jgi:hypothetical protein
MKTLIIYAVALIMLIGAIHATIQGTINKINAEARYAHYTLEYNINFDNKLIGNKPK